MFQKILGEEDKLIGIEEDKVYSDGTEISTHTNGDGDLEGVFVNGLSEDVFQSGSNSPSDKSIENKELSSLDKQHFPGVTISIDQKSTQGYFNPITKTIHIPGWANKSATTLWDYVSHEYGHYLQLQKYGYFDFMFIIGVSVISAKDDDHLENWPEIEANTMSNQYFLSKNPGHKSLFFDTNTYKVNHPTKQ